MFGLFKSINNWFSEYASHIIFANQDHIFVIDHVLSKKYFDHEISHVVEYNQFVFIGTCCQLDTELLQTHNAFVLCSKSESQVIIVSLSITFVSINGVSVLIGEDRIAQS